MTDLSRNLLAAAREGMTPSPDVMARVRAKVAASTAAATGGMAAIPAKAGTALATKLAIGALVVVAVTAGVVVLSSRSSQSGSPAATAIAPRATESDTPAAIHSTGGVHEQAAPPAREAPRVV